MDKKYDLDFSEYASLAEAEAIAKKQKAERLARKKQEAHDLQVEMCDALFDPYAGKAAIGDYNAPAVLHRHDLKGYNNSTMGLAIIEPENRAEFTMPVKRHGVRGWMLFVDWDDEANAFSFRLMVVSEHITSSTALCSLTGNRQQINKVGVTLAQALAKSVADYLWV